MVVMFLLAALGASIPQADINRICESAKVDSLPEDRVTAMRGCVGDETSARDQLRREWGRYSAADKNNCASTPGMQFSYVELLTCLRCNAEAISVADRRWQLRRRLPRRHRPRPSRSPE